MRRPRFTTETRKKLLEQIDKERANEARQSQLYNRFYRRNIAYIGAWIIRATYIILFIVVAVFHENSNGFRDEIVINKTVDSYLNTSRSSSHRSTTIHIKTNYDSYSSNLGNMRIPELKKNDTIKIERNIFGKPIYFTKNNWELKYGINLNFSIYYIILFITLISFFFNDGLDSFTSKILWFVYVINVIGIAIYFLV